MDNQSENTDKKKPGRFKKFLITLFCVIFVICISWVVFSLIGRVDAAKIIPDFAKLRISISNPVNLIDNILSHESLHEISAVQELAPAMNLIDMLHDSPVFKNRLLRLAARGSIEAALLAEEGKIAISWDMRLLSPLLRILPAISGFVTIPNLYYVQSGNNSRFELRTEDATFYIGPYRNLLFVTNSRQVFESRSAALNEQNSHSEYTMTFNMIKPSSHDIALILSGEFINTLLSEQDAGIAALLEKIEFDSWVEAGISIFPGKIEFNLAAPLSSGERSLSRILEQRSRAPGMAEFIPADAQYATILSAGTLNELYQAALVFTPELDESLRSAESTSRLLMGLTLDDLLFSWTGNEFAVFGIEGRPHPVYAIQIADERKRQEVFNRAFRSIVLNENVRLNFDGTRIPQISVPEFLQSLLRNWDIFTPSPYYIIYRDYILVSESAEALLSALRSMQRNNVLPGTASWRNIAGGRTTATSFSLYYSLDLSIPFFLRKNTTLGRFISLYQQGLARMSINRGTVEVSLVLVPGSGGGVIQVNGYPINIAGMPSNRIYGAGTAESGRIFFSSGDSAFSLNMADNSIHELSGQGGHWVISADGIGDNTVNAWVVTDRGRVTLVNSNMEPVHGFPVLTGMRLSSPPAAYNGRLYLCDENGKVHVIDENGRQSDWETVFPFAVRSPPSFLTVTTRNNTITYAAVYPKSFFGEIWLLNADGKAFPNWPAPISVNDEFGVGFGSPLVFAHNNNTREPAVRVAFINQSGLLIIYDENAAIVPPFPIILNGIFYQQPVFDGVYLWLISSEGTFFRVSMEGEVLYQHIHGFSVMEEGYITVFDIDGDNVPEVFITGDGNAFYGFTRNFRSLEGFPLPVWGKPFFIPAQGGRKAEIFGIGMSSRLYRWQFR